MTETTLEHKRVLLDKKGHRIPSELIPKPGSKKEKICVPKDKSRTDGVEYIYALLPPVPGSKGEKNRQKRKFLLRRPDGSPKPAQEFRNYDNRTPRSLESKMKAIAEAVKEVYAQQGYAPKQHALEVTANEQNQKRMISAVFKEYVKWMRETLVERTLKPRSESTIYESELAFRYYVEIFGDHSIDQFPRDVAGEFKLRLGKRKARPGSKEMISKRTIRKHGIALNVFFNWLSEKGFVTNAPSKLKLPSQSEKSQVRIWSTESMQMITNRIETLLAEAEKPQSKASKRRGKKKGRRMSDADLYRNHLRAWMMMQHCGLRLSEVWSLRLENIKMKEGKGFITIKAEIDEDGGLDHYKKPFRVQFRSKSGINETVQVPDVIMKFLKEDKLKRNNITRFKWEGWFLDRPDGSCAYRTAQALGKAIEKHQKALGIHGEAKRCHGTRSTLATEYAKVSIEFARQALRHKSVTTTEEGYIAETPDEVLEVMNQVSNRLAQK